MHKLSFLFSVLAVTVAVSLWMPVLTFAQVGNTTDQMTKGVEKAGGQEENAMPAKTFIKNTVNALLYIASALAVVMIIIGGIRYVTSQGQDAQIKSAKNMLLYAVIGLAVAIFAYAIVKFVMDKL